MRGRDYLSCSVSRAPAGAGGVLAERHSRQRSTLVCRRRRLQRDSRPDLVVNSFSGFSVLLNRGGGAFARPVTTAGEIHPMLEANTSQLHVRRADFNRDGRLDLAGSVDAASPAFDALPSRPPSAGPR